MFPIESGHANFNAEVLAESYVTYAEPSGALVSVNLFEALSGKVDLTGLTARSIRINKPRPVPGVAKSTREMWEAARVERLTSLGVDMDHLEV